MKHPLVSIIVPVYNVEKYISKCIDSILIQTFKNFELILLDDGSNDKSGNICDYYAKLDERVRVLHKKNEGVHKTRLIGINESIADLICFVDSDDLLTKDSLEILVKNIKDFDFVKGNMIICKDGKYILNTTSKTTELVSKNDYLESLLLSKISPFLWGTLYRKSIFDIKQLEQFSEFPIAEDFLSLLSIGNTISKIKIIPDNVYIYNINNNSVMNTKVISFDYSEKMKMMMFKTTMPTSEKIKNLIIFNRVIRNISLFFVPELKFDKNTYSFIYNFLFNEKKYMEVCKYVSPTYIFLIKYKTIYRIYSAVYKIIYKYLKLKGKKRTVI